MAERVFLDANLLFARLPRLLALTAARAGLIVPLWSPRVLEEWRRAALTKGGPEAAREVEAAIAALPPEGLVPEVPGEALAHQMRDPADAHVLASAAGAGAPVLLTFNLRDFPRRLSAGEGVEPRHPDGVFWELYPDAPQDFDAALAAELATPDRDIWRRALKRARLPRLGKAVATAP